MSGHTDAEVPGLEANTRGYRTSQERRAAVERARHSTEMEGGISDAAARAIQDRWARGEISDRQLIAETRILCGLPAHSS